MDVKPNLTRVQLLGEPRTVDPLCTSVPAPPPAAVGKDPFVTDKHGSPRVRLSVGEHYEDDDGAEQTHWQTTGGKPKR